jgi:hypothetical protein
VSDKLIQILGLALGWSFIALGVFLVARALFADRSRGRRRCPRCWYSMDGVPSLQCPECGRTAKREQRLVRTRRRYRRAVASSVILILGLTTLYISGAIRVGWTRAIPSSALVAFTPIDLGVWDTSINAKFASVKFYAANGPGRRPAPPPTGWREELSAELVRRVTNNELWHWQARLLARRIVIAGRTSQREPVLLDVPAVVDDAWLRSLQPRRAAADLNQESLVFFNSEVFAPATSRRNDNARFALQGLINEMLGVAPGARIGSVIIWWKVDTAGLADTILTALADAAPGRPASANLSGSVRVYDARTILATRFLALPETTLTTESDTLRVELQNRGRFTGILGGYSIVAFNGRLVVEGTREFHTAVETHLAECAKHPTARIPQD